MHLLIAIIQKMQQQLQSQIKKNKNLLQSNFSLMQQNEQYISALTQLKKYLSQQSNLHDNHDMNDDQYQQIACAEDAENIVQSIIKKIKQLQESNQSRDFITQEKGVGKECQCQKWKNMYVNQSQESLRLSKRVVELEQKIVGIQAKHQMQCKEMDNILKQYLVLFQRVHCVDFLQSQQTAKKTKQPQNTTTKPSKHSSSRSKPTHTSRSQSKKHKTSQSQKQDPQTIPTKVTEQISQFTNFINYLDGLRQDYSNLMLENKILRDQVSDAEMLIRVYREKERERLMYSKFVI